MVDGVRGETVPRLGYLRRNFPPITATEAPSERVFSRGGRLVKNGWSRTAGQERLVKNGGHRSRKELLKSRTFMASANQIDEMLAAKKHKLA